jgi:hypothetical protein
MCIHGHRDSYRSVANGHCLICHAEAMHRVRHGPKWKKYRLNKQVFQATVPFGNRVREFELAGISADTMGHYYAGEAFRDAERRNILAARLGLKHDQLWQEVM